ADLRAGANELYQDMKDSGRFNQDQIARAEDQANRMMNNWRLDGQMSGEQMDYARNLIASKILNSTDAVGMRNLDQIGAPAPAVHTAYDLEAAPVGGGKLGSVNGSHPTANPATSGGTGQSNEERVEGNAANAELVEDSQTTAAISRTGVIAAGVGAGVHGALGAGGAKAAEVAVKTGTASKGAKAFTDMVENLKK
ncbi:hypothetical protein ACQV5M_18820, partial [Leptospira sp. SA-E8]|uniref:hypothetical protein n=1 Tax=Leptospira sp. SA-E8 TaxID=3422259 RepID=UPI003EBF7F43